MRRFIDLTEQKGQIVFAFGRFNPPTTGHEKLISKVAQVSGSSPYRIYPSFSQNPKKDPLPHTLKVAYMRKMFSKHARNIVADKDAKTAINVAVKLYDEGFKDLVMVAGSDRVKEFSSLLKNYNGVEGKRHGFYKFDRIDVVSAGERDPDAEGVEGMSASKMRAAAVEGDFDSFQQGVPKGFKDAKKLYSDVRKYMGIREERHMGEMDEHEEVRDAYLTGRIWNVGDIVEANGIQGKVVRKGTNYIAFHDEEGRVHKAWLHEIELDEASSVYKKTATKAKNKEGTMYAFGRDKKLDGQPEEKGGYSVWKLKQNYAGGVRGGISKKWVYVEKDLSYSDAVKLMNKKLKYKGFNEEAELDERNYAKEYANYHGKPEQIARRSSRNKARRAMGDKVKVGMDVGHKDNDPLNNEPDNLRNEDPSKNRREPRLREEELSGAEKEKMKDYEKKIPKKDFIDRYGKERGERIYYATITNMAKKNAEEIEESPITGVLRKVNQVTHPKQYDAIVKAYVKSRKDDPKKTTSFAIDKIVRQYGGIDVRSVIDYINKLVKKGVLPKELKAGREVMSQEDIVKEWYESEVIRESYQDKYGDDWWWKLNEVHDRMLEKLGICCEDCISEQEMKCPPATKDLALNTKNRDATTKKYNYGPLNVDEPGDYWEKIAKHWKTSVEAAKKSLCANCVAFDISPRMKDCLPGDTFDDDGELGYCWMHHFKCHSARSCHTWAKGGPISKDSESHEWQERAFGKEKETKSETVSFTNFRKFNKWDEISEGAEYDGRSVKLNNPTKGDRKKYKVYVKNDKGNVVKVEFGDPNMEIKRDDPARRRSFRARHNCENPGPKWKARYWSCKFWSAKSVTDLMKG